MPEAERGAKDTGAESELVHLFDLNYTDCKSCFTCKLRVNTTNGLCAIRDDLHPVLEKIHGTDAVIIGSPIYYGSYTGAVSSIIHRMLFPVMHYENDNSLDELLPIRKKCGLIVTGNVNEEYLRMEYDATFESVSKMIDGIFGSCETLYACDTYQFEDYSRYYAGMFDAGHKGEHRERQFPIDMRKAYELGKRLVTN